MKFLCKYSFLFLVLSSSALLADPLLSSKPTFGMLLPLSGNYSAIGSDARQGIEAALTVSKDAKKINLIYADSKAEPVTSISEYRKLVDEDKVLAIYTIRSPVGMAINPLSKSSGIPILGGVGHKDFSSDNPHAYQVWSKADEEGSFLADIFKEKQFKRVALITTQDEWMMSTSNGFRERLKKISLQLAYDQEFVPTETDFRTAISQVRSKNADVLFVNLGLSQLGTFFRQARDQNLRTNFFSNFYLSKKDVIESAGKAIEGVRFLEMSTKLPTFQKIITENFNAIPSGATLSAYIGTLMLTKALESLHEAPSPHAIDEALRAMNEIVTPDGPLPIKDRRVQFPLLERVMHDGKPE